MKLVIRKEGESCLLNRLPSLLATFVIHAYYGAEIGPLLAYRLAAQAQCMHARADSHGCCLTPLHAALVTLPFGASIIACRVRYRLLFSMGAASFLLSYNNCVVKYDTGIFFFLKVCILS